MSGRDESATQSDGVSGRHRDSRARSGRGRREAAPRSPEAHPARDAPGRSPGAPPLPALRTATRPARAPAQSPPSRGARAAGGRRRTAAGGSGPGGQHHVETVAHRGGRAVRAGGGPSRPVAGLGSGARAAGEPPPARAAAGRPPRTADPAGAPGTPPPPGPRPAPPRPASFSPLAAALPATPPGPPPGPTPARPPLQARPAPSAGLSGFPRVTPGGRRGGVGHPAGPALRGLTPQPRDGHFSDKMGCEALWGSQGSGSPWGRGASDPTPPALPCPGGSQARGALCRGAGVLAGSQGTGRAGTSGVREKCWVQRPEWRVCPAQGKTAQAED